MIQSGIAKRYAALSLLKSSVGVFRHTKGVRSDSLRTPFGFKYYRKQRHKNVTICAREPFFAPNGAKRCLHCRALLRCSRSSKKRNL